MTINRSQSQTLTRVGLYLPKPVFAHGQLYVAMSRVGKMEHITAFIAHDKPVFGKEELNTNKETYTQNIVYKSIVGKD